MHKKRNSPVYRIIVKACKAASALFPENHMLRVTEYAVRSERLPAAFDGFRILQLSDLHSASFGRDNVRLLQRIEAAKPDMIVMTGDMVSRSDSDRHVFFRLAETVGKAYPCYYVIGNHEQDMERDELKAFLVRLAALHIRVLDNERISLKRGEQSISLYGMWFSLKYYREANLRFGHTAKFTDRGMKRLLGSFDPSHYGILLTHSPLCFPVYARWGADLTLCGHVHGGMIRLPFLGGLLSPEREFFPKYSAGIYKEDGGTLFVSRGLGSGVFGARILNMPEIAVITLHSIN